MKQFKVSKDNKTYHVFASDSVEAVNKVAFSISKKLKDSIKNIKVKSVEELKSAINNWNRNDSMKVEVWYSNTGYFSIYYYKSTDGYYSVPIGITSTLTEYDFDRAKATALKYAGNMFKNLKDCDTVNDALNYSPEMSAVRSALKGIVVDNRGELKELIQDLLNNKPMNMSPEVRKLKNAIDKLMYFSDTRKEGEQLVFQIARENNLTDCDTINDADKIELKLVKKKNDYDEFVIKVYKNGKYYEPASYYTDDWEDAVGTFKDMAKRQGLTVKQQGSMFIADCGEETVNDSTNPLVNKVQRDLQALGLRVVREGKGMFSGSINQTYESQRKYTVEEFRPLMEKVDKLTERAGRDITYNGGLTQNGTANIVVTFHGIKDSAINDEMSKDVKQKIAQAEKELEKLEAEADKYESQAEKCRNKGNEEGYSYYTDYANEIRRKMDMKEVWLSNFIKQHERDASPLWNGKYRPEDITPEFIQSLSIPEAERLLRWMNTFKDASVFSEETMNSVKEGIDKCYESMAERKENMVSDSSIKDSKFEEFLDTLKKFGVTYKEVPNDSSHGVAYDIRYTKFATGNNIREIAVKSFGKHIIENSPGRIVIGD